ncbi:unnamed protein product [Rotaria magnacalcarata]|uniref:Cap-specific mRNA (nucleoside-2'-O-)-methyltransferase 1 n=1 Tax=Rotaria magnacalcarata TaxID=392030 RepID=A0A819PK17_9BILA|nr:unnamed protein product [Rotaria magnacalcarata]CAF4015684.1 unnamed protein product [Rotaria magnacalcarata]
MSYNNFNNSRRNNWRDNGRDRFGQSRDGNRPNQNYQYNNSGRTSSLTDEESLLVYQGRDELFDKKKTFPIVTASKNKSLLLAENLFKADRWNIEELIVLKNRLNNTRNRLNEKDIKVWKQHTQKTNMTGRVVWSLRRQNCIEMCTNAWIKMAEIFSKYETLIPKALGDNQSFRSLHVCEAPGAFICATNFYYNERLERKGFHSSKCRWEWTGLSLNPYYEGNDQEAMVDDDRFIIETLDRWYFGIDNSGNILDTNNIQALWKRVRTDPKITGVHLVTGDGSVDTSADPNEQESIVSELHYAEAISALGALAKDGSLVLKMFNLFECETICLLYILALHFKELSIFKPASSRAPNGETYIIAVGFRGIDSDILQSLLSFVSPKFPSGKTLLSRNSIPQFFIDAVIEFAEYFTMKQVQALERNLELEKIWNRNIQEAIFQLNQDIAKEFGRQCHIDYHYKQRIRIVTDVELDGSAKGLGNSASVVKGGLRQRTGGTLDDRQNKKRKREDFLLGDTTTNNSNNNEDIDDERGEGKPIKRINFGHGKSVVVGQDTTSKSSTNDTTTTTDIGTDQSIRQSEEPKNESIAMKMMKKSGYVEGKGLGVQGQGRATPIETIMHDTRLGLGHHYQPSINSCSFSDLPKVIDEPLFTSFDQSISNISSSPILNLPIKTTGFNLKSVLSSLFVKFDDLESLYKRREEYISKIENNSLNKPKIFISDQLELLNNEERYRNIHGIYVDYKTAFQLASLDKIFKLTTIDLKDSSRLSFIIDNKSLTGFAEYLVWKQQNHINGLIISDLQNSCSFSSYVTIKSQINQNHPKVQLFFSDCSILPTNHDINRRYIEKYNKQQLIIACRRALTMLNNGGHFVCLMLDTLTRFTAGIIYILYLSFESITIIRPFTVNPARSERFLVCHKLKYPVYPSIIQHLDNLIKCGNMENILEIVPVKCLTELQFQQYLADTSQRLLQREIQALDKRLWYIGQKNYHKIDPTISEKDWTEAHEYVTVPRRSNTVIAEPDSTITLPIGWSKPWSTKEKRFYYFNENTGKSRWDPPT